MRRLEIDIARRLAIGGEKGKSSPAVIVAQISVALSVAVMIVAIGIVFGFKSEITRKVLGLNPQITLYPQIVNPGESRASITVDQRLSDFLDSRDYIKDWHPTINLLALLKTSDTFKGLYLYGLSSKADTLFLHDNLIEGRLPEFGTEENGKASILISRVTADELSLSPGDSINVYSFGQSTKIKRMEVSGIYDTHLEMFDNTLAYTTLATAADLGDYGQDEVSSINISTFSFDDITPAGRELAKEIQEFEASSEEDRRNDITYGVTTILDSCKGIFGWLGLLDTNVWVILILLTLVSAFSLISGMLIIILEKVRFIGVMKAMGTSSKRIRQIFIWLAMRIGFRGMIYGTVLGLALLAIQYYLHIVHLNPQAYYMNYAPVSFNWIAFAVVEAGFAIVIYLSLTIPSRFVSRISPSESMRFEQ